jgi:hypothetical protein
MKQFIAAFFTLLINTLANGQTIQSIGLKNGLSIATQTWQYESIAKTLEQEYRQGLYSAFTLDFLQSKYFNITTDIGYCQKGAKDKTLNTSAANPEGDGTYKYLDTKFNYFMFSPLFKAKYQINHWTSYALIGFRLDYQLSYQSDFNLKIIDKEFNKTIWGLTSGAGLEYKLKKIGINTEFQYQSDLTKLMNTKPSATNVGLEINNQAFIICLGVRYYLQKSTDIN